MEMKNQILLIIVVLITIQFVVGRVANGQVPSGNTDRKSSTANWSVELSQVTTLAPISAPIKMAIAAPSPGINHHYRNHQPAHHSHQDGLFAQENLFDDTSDSIDSRISVGDGRIVAKPSPTSGISAPSSPNRFVDMSNYSSPNKWIPYKTEPSERQYDNYEINYGNPQPDYLQNEYTATHSDHLIDSLGQWADSRPLAGQQSVNYMTLNSMSKYLNHKPNLVGSHPNEGLSPLISKELLQKALEIHESLMRQNSTNSMVKKNNRGFKIFANERQNQFHSEDPKTKKRPLQRASKLRDELLVDSFDGPRLLASKVIAQQQQQQLHKPSMDQLESRQTESIRDHLAQNLYSSLPFYFATSIPEAKRLDLSNDQQLYPQSSSLHDSLLLNGRSFQQISSSPPSGPLMTAASHHNHHHHAFGELPPTTSSYGIYHSDFPFHHAHKTAISSRSEKGLLKPILVGVAASLVSFLIISNLFLSIPLFAITLWQLCNGGLMGIPMGNMNNMQQPTNQMPNSNNQNQNAQLSAQLAGKKRRRRRAPNESRHQLGDTDDRHNWIPDHLSWLTKQ